MFFTYFKLLITTLSCFAKTKQSLVLENASLRQQLIVLKRKSKRVNIEKMDRKFWIFLKNIWTDWRSTLFIVQPETVIKWHRDFAKKRWGKLSLKKTGGGSRIDKEIQELIHRMALENRTWGAGRIYGELLKLGFKISERTVSRYMPKYPERRQSWRTFLKNHCKTTCGLDLFTVFTANFR